MLRRLLHFWRGLLAHWLSAAGVVLTTSAFVVFLLAELLRMSGAVTNAYVGLITYLALPALFVLGLLLIPLGWWRLKRRSGKTHRQLLAEMFNPDFVQPRPIGSKLFITIGLLTLVNIVFLAAGGARMLGFMNQPRFCGTACHSVMHPEWITYQRSPHARVACVECHVGQGLEAELDAKLNGVWQMISITFDLYERPIPTPVAQLRPAQETCERCHWPAMFYGRRVERLVRYATDRSSTPRHTTLSLKVGSGRRHPAADSWIHWHVAEQNAVRYRPADRQRLQLEWVEVRQPDGGWKRYSPRRPPVVAQDERDQAPDGGWPVRRMDCVDCHNRVTHIYEDPARAVDRRIAAGELSRTLPFVKRQALAALTGSYPPEQAAAAIEHDFAGYYRRHHPGVWRRQAEAVEQAVAVLQNVHARNVHPRMNVTWNAYEDHLGHSRGPGCRRCHSPDMIDAQGRPVPNHCTLCHSILAYDSSSPFAFLQPLDPGDPECWMHLQLRREFLGPAAAGNGDSRPCAEPQLEAEGQSASR